MPRPGLHRPGRVLPGREGGPAGAASDDPVRSGRLYGRGLAGWPRGGGRYGCPHQPHAHRCNSPHHLVPAARPVRGCLSARSVSWFPKWLTYLPWSGSIPISVFYILGPLVFTWFLYLCTCLSFVLSSGTVTFIRIRDISPGSGTLIYMVTSNNIFRIRTDIERFQERHDIFQELYRGLLIYFRSCNWWRAWILSLP